MGDFEVDTRIEALGNGRYGAVVSRDWEIWGPNGGYMAALAMRATGRVAKVQRPASFTGHFLSVAQFDEVEIEVRTLKAGRRAESFAVSIRQADRAIFEGLVRTAAESPGLEHDVAEIPENVHPSELQDIADLVDEDDGTPHAFWRNFEVRPVWPERFAEGERIAHPPTHREWYRFKPQATFEDPWLDASRALLMIDTASWIAAVQPHPDSDYIAPNVDVTAWFHRAEPASEWLLMDHHCPVADGGLMGTHARIWSENGNLLASGGAQLLCVLSARD